MATRRRVEPRTFFLNETHELSPGEKAGRGGLPKFHGIEWESKGKRISASLTNVVEEISKSSDPLRESRFFIIADPVESVQKRREDKDKNLKEIYEEKTEYGSNERQSRTFDRLGLDLIQVMDDGRAIVHAERATIDSLRERTASLATLGPMEQSRWATIDAFEQIPLQLRVDEEWLDSLSRSETSDVIIEMQPVLRRIEADSVLRVIADILRARSGESLTGTGTDYSGRHWFRAKAKRGSVNEIARDFYSVQALHPPLYSMAAGKKKSGVASVAPQNAATPPAVDVDDLPCVAVVDLGVPNDHKQLASYRRGSFVPPGAAKPPVGKHGSLVASRVVFGSCDGHDELRSRRGRCCFYDAMVGDYPGGTGQMNRVDDKIVLAAMTGVTGTAPDVRVFNLSFGDTRPLDALDDVERRERNNDLQNLDNYIFANDVLVVVAAGNSALGVIPTDGYPNHVDDPRWRLGPWACGFNTLVCGAFVGTPSFGGLAGNAGWPSPHTRIGPGLSDCPVPSFSADGGDIDETYQHQNGLGVWCFSDAGLPEDHTGTSYAAPLLAREAAFTLSHLERHCEPGTDPFASPQGRSCRSPPRRPCPTSR